MQDISKLGVRDFHIWFKKSPSLEQEISKLGVRDPEFGVIDLQIWCERSPNLLQEISNFVVRILHEVWLCNYVLCEINAKKVCFSKGKAESLLIFAKLFIWFLRNRIGDGHSCLLSDYVFCEKLAHGTWYILLGTKEIIFRCVPWNRMINGTKSTPLEVVCTKSQTSPLVNLFNRRWLVKDTAQWLHAEDLDRVTNWTGGWGDFRLRQNILENTETPVPWR